jgi:hypothetical protein
MKRLTNIRIEAAVVPYPDSPILEKHYRYIDQLRWPTSSCLPLSVSLLGYSLQAPDIYSIAFAGSLINERLGCGYDRRLLEACRRYPREALQQLADLD